MSSSYSYKPGDWACSWCGFVNFAKKTECSKCRTSKVSNTPMKPGDWICPSCHDLNFASRNTCRKCSGNKPSSDHPAAPVWKPGDWSCPSCSEHNFGSRSTCRKCNASKDGQQQSNVASNSNNSSSDSAEITGECVVCMEKKADHVITLCGHMVLCGPCSSGVDKCPMCRKPFTRDQILRVFSG